VHLVFRPAEQGSQFPGFKGLRAPAPVLACAPGIAAALSELVGAL